MKTTSTVLKWVAGSIGIGVLTGCVATTPTYDSHFGDSVKVLMAQQVLNPDASSNPNNPAMDGQAAHSAIELYNKSFKAPTPPANVFTIGVGSGQSQ
ncbi:hypothetical protein ACFQAT_03565 [Undibacterium arcticum]|uniref:Pilus assembly protein n=1 Tax=Undibacterium arcticum TaxID=1762892 RepID=A0ABV7F129_9BURK